MNDRTLSKYINAGRERCIKKNDIVIASSNADVEIIKEIGEDF